MEVKFHHSKLFYLNFFPHISNLSPHKSPSLQRYHKFACFQEEIIKKNSSLLITSSRYDVWIFYEAAAQSRTYVEAYQLRSLILFCGIFQRQGEQINSGWTRVFFCFESSTISNFYDFLILLVNRKKILSNCYSASLRHSCSSTSTANFQVFNSPVAATVIGNGNHTILFSTHLINEMLLLLVWCWFGWILSIFVAVVVFRAFWMNFNCGCDFFWMMFVYFCFCVSKSV